MSLRRVLKRQKISVYKKYLNPIMTSSPIHLCLNFETDDNPLIEIDDSISDDSFVSNCLSFDANYVLFGTFMSYCRCLQLNHHFLKLMSVTPNISLIGFSYDITLAFPDIKQLMYCSDLKNPLVFIEINKKSNYLIQTAMNLGHNSSDGLLFDIHSNDIVDRYIVIDVSEEESNLLFIKHLIRRVKKVNKHLIVRKIMSENVKRFLKQNTRKCVASYKSQSSDQSSLHNRLSDFSPQSINLED